MVVRCREREWILLPSDQPEVYRLRPLTGVVDEAIEVLKPLSNLIGYALPTERVEPASFPLPEPQAVGDAASARLLLNSARLLLREGASPLRSLGRISIRPRTYQFVPLLMALRIDPVRLLIADDVGVGKTIEAGMIARELWERGEIQRLAVLCPPYLCDQWARELSEKFNLPAVIIRSSTLSQLERAMPVGARSVYQHYPVQVISIDWAKSERNKYLLLQYCPELVIIDEAHNAVPAGGLAQQQRYELVQAIAQDANRHLILLTATPHSGIPEAFQKLLGLLNPAFEAWQFSALTNEQRDTLARHFVQRTRADIERDWEHEACFPQREQLEVQYALSDTARRLFQQTYEFCLGLTRGASLESSRDRMRYWAALALLRSVMSSPAAALEALRRRSNEPIPYSDEEPVDESLYVSETLDPTLLDSTDETPTELVRRAAEADAERRQLRQIAQTAESMLHNHHDSKLSHCVPLVEQLLRDGFQPILWCRFVKTAEYVADALKRHFETRLPDLQVVCITGQLADEDRRALVEAIETDRPRVLVATDCLSEGVNLQEKFNAVLHYDLPWNPNKLEQREGRVDRYGQPARQVRTYRYYSPDNPVDGVVIRVLLNKAAEIRKTLGTYVPVPEDDESVQRALLSALFMHPLRTSGEQLALDMEMPALNALITRMERDAERERLTRTRFAQRALKPEEVQRELEQADQILGEPERVRQFVLEALPRLGVQVSPSNTQPGVYRLSVANLNELPLPVRQALLTLAPPRRAPSTIRIAFHSPTPEGATYIGRNHPLTQALAQYLFETAFAGVPNSPAQRCGAIATRAVQRPTALYLLRQRYLIHTPEQPETLAEETLAFGIELETRQPLPPETAQQLIEHAQPSANLPAAQKTALIEHALSLYPDALHHALQDAILNRAVQLETSHKRIRQSLRRRTRELQLEPLEPSDLMGVLVLVPAEGSR
jgi:superfamily II DNA or RNA helicase